jgi:hypothetical protein
VVKTERLILNSEPVACKRLCRRQLRWLGCLGFSYSIGEGERRRVALLMQRFKLVLVVEMLMA